MRRADPVELHPFDDDEQVMALDAATAHAVADSVADSFEEAFAHRLADLHAALPVQDDKPNETPEATLRVLWHLAAGRALSMVSAASLRLPALSEAAMANLDALIAQRLSGQPLAHLSQRQHFMGLDMLVGPQALIPRLETEQLGHVALSLLQGIKQPIVLDLCTGCGNLALALAHHAPQAQVLGGDLCGAAIALARRNAQHLGLGPRVDFRVGDLFEPFQEPDLRGNIDLVVCNPPYISSAKIDRLPPEIHHHEPRLAFDGGPLGVNVLHRLLRDAALFLRPGGWLALEVGRGQGQSVMKRLCAQAAPNLAGAASFETVLSASDAGGDIRVVMARRAVTPLKLN
jgi:release factor glutamine methyltransferase